MSKKQKYYTVWEGVNPGVYNSWKECEKQIKGYEGAKFKSFETLKEAQDAFMSSCWEYIGKNAVNTKPIPNYRNLPSSEQPILNSIAVDAACAGNPGKMEYRGVDVNTGTEIFRQGPFENGTNNIGEFLAIVHALALFNKTNPRIPVYTDSVTALAWVKGKKCKTKLGIDKQNQYIFQLIERAEKWLRENTFSNPLIKWETEKWGEIPADFGRK
ncbi:MAG: ribonuclease [Bacteroidetes bacterium]|nr:ribonuclease [Bacteroidota bacterium]